MGCWEETCALTNTPIYAGERCVMLELDKEQLDRYMKLNPLTPIGIQGSDSQWRMFKAIHRGTYNDYGWLEELGSLVQKAPGLPVVYSFMKLCGIGL